MRSEPGGEGRRGFLDLKTEDFAAYFEDFEHARASTWPEGGRGATTLTRRARTLLSFFGEIFPLSRNLRDRESLSEARCLCARMGLD
jgi:hypothetical protein